MGHAATYGPEIGRATMAADDRDGDGTVHLGSRALTIRLMPAASEAERVALRAFLADIAQRCFSLPGDPDRRRLAGRQVSDRLRRIGAQALPA
jgi:hypothetical protein